MSTQAATAPLVDPDSIRTDPRVIAAHEAATVALINHCRRLGDGPPRDVSFSYGRGAWDFDFDLQPIAGATPEQVEQILATVEVLS